MDRGFCAPIRRGVALALLLAGLGGIPWARAQTGETGAVSPAPALTSEPDESQATRAPRSSGAELQGRPGDSTHVAQRPIPRAETASSGGLFPRALVVQQARDTLRLTLKEAIDLARSTSPRVAQLGALLEAARWAEREAAAARWPTLDLSAGYTRFSDVEDFVIPLPSGERIGVAPNLPDAWRSRLGVRVPLFTGGRVANLLTAARHEREAAAQDRLTGQADLILETTAAFWDLLMARQSARVVAEALLAYESHLTDARNRERLGLAARNEILAVEVERDRAIWNRLRAESAARAHEANLARLVGVPPGLTLIPEAPATAVTHDSGRSSREALTPGDAPVAAESRASASPEPIPPTRNLAQDAAPLDPFEIPADSLEMLLSQARTARPDLAALIARVGAAEARAHAEAAARWPQLAGAGGYDYANPNRRFMPPEETWKQSWDASVQLSYTIWDFGRAGASSRQAKARAQALRQQLRELEQRIRHEITTRMLDVRTARAALTVTERAEAAARENLQVVRDRYVEGMASSSDLLDAEVTLLRSGLERTEAQAQAHLSNVHLGKVLGRLR